MLLEKAECPGNETVPVTNVQPGSVLGSTANTRAKPSALGRCGAQVPFAVLSLGRWCRADRSAVDARGLHGRKETAIETAVTSKHDAVAESGVKLTRSGHDVVGGCRGCIHNQSDTITSRHGLAIFRHHSRCSDLPGGVNVTTRKRLRRLRCTAKRAFHLRRAGGERDDRSLLANTGLATLCVRRRGVSRQPAVYVSRESHLAWVKTAHRLGIGRESVRL